MKPKTIVFVCKNEILGQKATIFLKDLLPQDYVVRSTSVENLTARVCEVADIIIFFQNHIYLEALADHLLDARKTWVLNISESFNAKLKSQMIELAEVLTAGCWTDIMDSNDRPTGLRLPISWASSRGLWHQSAHLLLITKERKVIVEKRSETIIFSPGLIDISMGGVVDSGERPLQSAIRECYEELGIRLRKNQMTRLGVMKENVWHSRLQKYSRSHKYVYLALLDEKQILYTPDPEEVSGVAELTFKQVDELIKKSYLPGVGRLVGTTKMYRQMMKKAKTALKSV